LKYSYESEKDDLIWDFYIPMLSYAKRYDRISGFFSSTSLALAARGLAGMIERGGTMRLITCPRLSKEDAAVISLAVDDYESILSKQLINDLDQVQDQFQKDHIAALGWMLAKGYLKIKIALVYENSRICNSEKAQSHSIMHQKVGILYDEDFNGVSFSGSNNESASGWLFNSEKFKVFCSWEMGIDDYLKNDIDDFNDLWNNRSDKTEVIEFPEAVKKELIKFAPTSKVEINSILDELIELESNQINPPDTVPDPKPITLRNYQEEAISKWFKNGCSGLLEMATGTGKTYTAISAMERMIAREKNIVIIISCPFLHLISQWEKSIEEFRIKHPKVIACSINPNWKKQIIDR
jgi:primosomal protein N'